jgi:hypothetical protein
MTHGRPPDADRLANEVVEEDGVKKKEGQDLKAAC